MVEKLPYLPDEHHYAIAAVATRASQLDHHIEHTVHMVLLRQPETSEYLLKNIGEGRMVGLLQAVLLDAIPENKEAIQRLIQDIDRVRHERNEIMHWIWGKAAEPDKALHATMRPFRKQERKTKTAQEIQKIADDMLTCVGALIEWSNLIHSRLPPLPLDKFLQQALRTNSASPSGKNP